MKHGISASQGGSVDWADLSANILYDVLLKTTLQDHSKCNITTFISIW